MPSAATGERVYRDVVVMPAHDEADTIGAIVTRALQHVDCVVVVDDASTDDTGSRASAAGAVVLTLSPNRGKGAALRLGLAEALRTGAARVVTMDADGEHSPDDLPALLAALDCADVALGHRDVYRSRARRMLNGLSLFWFRLLAPEVQDTICGFRAFRAPVLAGLRCEAEGFTYEHEVLLRLVHDGRKLASVPIATTPRARSHVTTRDLLHANNHFDRWVLRHLRSLPVSPWRKVLLLGGCTVGYCLGVPAAWLVGVRRP